MPAEERPNEDSDLHDNSRMLGPPPVSNHSDGNEDLEQQDAITLEELERSQPPDRFYLVYIIMVVHGIGLLIPWNTFITAKSYFEDYKLNQTEQADEEVQDYRTFFVSYIGMAAQFPNAVMNLINLFCQFGGRPVYRIVGSIVIIVIFFVVTIILAMVDSSEWPETFFWVTLMSVVIMNSAGGVYQNSLYGVVAMLPMKYTNAVIFGNNVCGTLVAGVNILTIALAPDIKMSAMYYFVAGAVILLIAADSYFVLPHSKFFRHYQLMAKLKQQQRRTSQPEENTCIGRLGNYWRVFKEIWVLALSVWFVFFVSLALFPQIQSDIKKRSFPIQEVYWTPVFCFLSFNVFAMLGNLLSEVLHFPGPRFVWIPVVSRVVFIPLYLMLNFHPKDVTRSWTPFLASDYVFLLCSVLMALSGGYLSSLCMMYAPKKVEGPDAGTAGMMMSFFLVIGILSGVNAARVLASLV